jgi:hypothetical protein
MRIIKFIPANGRQIAKISMEAVHVAINGMQIDVNAIDAANSARVSKAIRLMRFGRIGIEGCLKMG